MRCKRSSNDKGSRASCPKPSDSSEGVSHAYRPRACALNADAPGAGSRKFASYLETGHRARSVGTDYATIPEAEEAAARQVEEADALRSV